MNEIHHISLGLTRARLAKLQSESYVAALAVSASKALDKEVVRYLKGVYAAKGIVELVHRSDGACRLTRRRGGQWFGQGGNRYHTLHLLMLYRVNK